MDYIILKNHKENLKIIYSPFLDAHFLNLDGLNYYLEKNFYEELKKTEKSKLYEKIKFYNPDLFKMIGNDKINSDLLSDVLQNLK